MSELDLETAAVEARLRAYRPAAPPEGLRERVLAGAPAFRHPSIPGWLTLAALLFLAVALRWSARSDLAATVDRTRSAPVPLAAPGTTGLDADRALVALQRWAERQRQPDPRRSLVDPPFPGGAR